MYEAVATARERDGATVIDLELGDDDAALAAARAGLGDAWTDAKERELVTEVQASLASAVAAAKGEPPPPAESLFEGVFAALPPHLARQRAELLSR